MIAMAERDLIELDKAALAFRFHLEDPMGVRLVPGNILDAGVEADILEKVKMHRVVVHELLEMVRVHVYRILWIFTIKLSPRRLANRCSQEIRPRYLLSGIG